MFITIHKQRDGRFTLGTVIHKNPECLTPKQRLSVIVVTGEICKIIPKCKKCYKK